MSSIRLSGSTSGYYDLTVPAVAGTNSIDLSNLVINGQSSIGIGTASPTSELHFNTASPIVKVEATNQSSGLRVNTIGQSSGQLFRVQKDNVTQFEIDYNGYMKLPNRPAFHAYGSPSRGATGGTHTIYNFVNNNGTGQSYNTGNHYDNSNGRFTAPIGGTYFFYGGIWMSQSQSSTGNRFLQLIRNHTNEFAGCNYWDQYESCYVGATVRLNSGDYVTLDLVSGSVQGSTPRNYFGGYFIG